MVRKHFEKRFFFKKSNLKFRLTKFKFLYRIRKYFANIFLECKFIYVIFDKATCQSENVCCDVHLLRLESYGKILSQLLMEVRLSILIKDKIFSSLCSVLLCSSIFYDLGFPARILSFMILTLQHALLHIFLRGISNTIKIKEI